jgi:hypothetical protein
MVAESLKMGPNNSNIGAAASTGNASERKVMFVI